MIILGISLLLIAVTMAIGLKKHIGLSVPRSTILGLTLCVPVALGLISEIVNLGVIWSIRLGCLLGGMELHEIQTIYLQRMAEKLLNQRRGVRSTDSDENDN